MNIEKVLLNVSLLLIRDFSSSATLKVKLRLSSKYVPSLFP